MSIFSNKKNSNVEISQRHPLQNKYTSAYKNILLVVGLTVLNILLLVTNSNTYFLFSAYIPYFLVDLGMYLCGMYSTEYYAAGTQFLSKSFFAVTLGIAAVMVLLYILSWLFAKKQKGGWLIFALVFFSIDTLAMFALNGIVLESLMDYAIHVWVIVSLVNGVVSFFKLKGLPPEVPCEEQTVADVHSEEVSEESV